MTAFYTPYGSTSTSIIRSVRTPLGVKYELPDGALVVTDGDVPASDTAVQAEHEDLA